MSRPTLGVVIPARNAARTLRACLGALESQQRPPDRIIVVDDGSTDGTIAAAGSVELLRHTASRGPGAARNTGTANLDTDLVWFVDSDTTPHPDAAARLIAHFQTEPSPAAVFGAYDDRPAVRRWSSWYKNLLHHHVHRRSPGATSCFWSGCGAIRLETFRRLGGFDETSVLEDVELGLRLHRDGHPILSDPTILTTHHKEWPLLELWKTDLCRRAIPWLRMLVDYRSNLPRDLNFHHSDRVGAASAWATLASITSAIFLKQPALTLAATLPLGVWIAQSAPFLNLLFRRKGMAFALYGASLHFLYQLYGSLLVAVFFLPYRIGQRLAAPKPQTARNPNNPPHRRTG